MASIESNLFYYLLRLINKKRFLEMQFAFGKFDFYESREPSAEVYKTCHVSKRRVGGHNVFTLSPKFQKSGKHILYLHGGAYVQGFVKQHWTFLCLIVARANCTITAPAYPLAPLNTFLDAFDAVTPLYWEILTDAGTENMIVMGDSAGGGFALALVQKMKSDGAEPPAKIILLSPWLDITLKNPDIAKIDREDPFLGVSALRKAGLAYAGNANPEQFMLSPINGPLEGLGQISVFAGSRDILVADARKLNELARQKGIAINYREYPDMVHVWMLLNFRESKQAKEEIIQLIE